MRVIIAGSRNCTDFNLLLEAINESGYDITTVVSGRARGVDTLGETWARQHHRPVDTYPADWDHYGKAAGHIRNTAMAKNADALIALLAPDSRGTANMIKQAEKHGLKIFIKPIPTTIEEPQ